MNHLPAIQVIIPLLCAPLCLLLRWRTGAWLIATIATWATFGVSLVLARTVVLNGAITYAMGGWPAPWGISYHVDTLSAFLVLIVSGVGALTLAFAYKSVQREIRPESLRAFYALLLICLAGLLGIVLTGDAFNIYVFLEISSLSAYALIGMGQRRRALRAAFQYLIMGTIGATFILIGIGLLYSLTGTLNIQDLAARVEMIPASTYGNHTLITAFAFLTVGLSLK
ncbi:MAG: proton-conducting transporter membrane subunit, partial [Desulfuromonas sp.]